MPQDSVPTPNQRQRLGLRTRLLLSYALLLLISSTVIVYLSVQVDDFNRQLQQNHEQVANEAMEGSLIADTVSRAQQAIDRYLQYPQPATLTDAQTALLQLEMRVTGAESRFETADQQQRQRQLAEEVARYKADFATLSQLVEDQADIQSDATTRLFNINLTLNNAIAGYLRGPRPDIQTVNLFAQASQQLFEATLWSSRLFTNAAEDSDIKTINALNTVDSRLTRIGNDVGDSTRTIIARAGNDVDGSLTAIRSYVNNRAQLREQRSRLLDVQGVELKRSADAIRDVALSQLDIITTAIEQQQQRNRQLIAFALSFALIVAIVVGLVLSRTITQPLVELVAATTQISQGSYDVTVPVRDRSEVGLLSAAFNHMMTTLREQRELLLGQQQALTERHTELQAAFTALQEASETQRQLEATIQELSIPVLSIIDRVVLVPLVGILDQSRAELLMKRLLQAVETMSARIAILDITGVPRVDQDLVRQLVLTSDAVRLLGGHCLIVGIKPEIAEAFVVNGLDLQNLVTRIDLHSAVAYAIEREKFVPR
jgi:anti-anti-sigma regulatory factor/nitrogen fixation/metabolism regulation signal transduction histidine kinase